MKTNSKIKDFKLEISEIVKKQINAITKSEHESIAKIDTLKFTSFNNDNVYNGETSNKIFFTYSDCYRGNSPVYMTAGRLHHSHQNMDDRGYIKGVATDLDGYMILRTLEITHNYSIVVNMYKPKFIKSKHSGAYVSQCDTAIADGLKLVDEALEISNEKISKYLKDKTGCSLIHYIRPL